MSHAYITVPSVCRDRKWNCTDHVCDATCSTIGMAHYLTFDGLKYMFPGECQYVLAQVRMRVSLYLEWGVGGASRAFPDQSLPFCL